ncbi:hypothetical protein BDV59DRAFT_174824 [Aspergillus ambiguus]|uniref:uncharacterized protein n=1 Tax=Aspergillus ambiguus TaxID=176160 RepID=UPI003CCCD364
MFVYPREPKLVSKYLRTYGDQGVQVIVWLGPRADWGDYESCFLESSFSEINLPADPGVVPYEMMAVMRKKTR